MEKDIDFEKIVRGMKVPVLVLDNRWQQLFPQENRPPLIRKLEKNLMAAMKKQANLESELKELKKLKKKLMSEIVKNMNEVASEEKEEKRKKKLDKSQQLINEINEKIDKNIEQLDEMPDLIKKANENLMIASVKICYEKMNTNNYDIEMITEWIENTRTELKKQILIKQDKQDENTRIYSYLHDIMGPRYMEVFDETDGDIS